MGEQVPEFLVGEKLGFYGQVEEAAFVKGNEAVGDHGRVEELASGVDAAILAEHAFEDCGVIACF